MFWGLIMEPNKRYTQVVEKPFHISQAAMDISTGDNEPCQVMVVVDSKNFLVATLQKTKQIQVPLDLYFKAGDNIAFLTNGKSNVHLTGYLDPEFEEELSDEEEEDEEEAPELVPVNGKNKRKLDTSSDSAASKKPKQDKKAAKKPVAEDSDESDEDKSQLQKFLDGEDVDTDENDDSFKVNTSGEADSDEEESSDDEEADAEEDDDDDDDDDDDEEEDDTQINGDADSDEADTTLDTSKEDPAQDMSKLSKSQKRRLKKKLAQEKADKAKPQVNGVEKKKAEAPAKAEKKKPEVKKEQAEPKKAEAGDKKEKKSLSGGVAIEDLKVGSGPVAKPGKVVQVYYEGRLKTNNKMFDNCVKGPGFKFRLGSKEVITGWDVGVAGMKVGGKRKIVCPPAMAYGAKGSPPVIPPNSTLVFEVELKSVK